LRCFGLASDGQNLPDGGCDSAGVQVIRSKTRPRRGGGERAFKLPGLQRWRRSRRSASAFPARPSLRHPFHSSGCLGKARRRTKVIPHAFGFGKERSPPIALIKRGRSESPSWVQSSIPSARNGRFESSRNPARYGPDRDGDPLRGAIDCAVESLPLRGRCEGSG